MNAMGPARDLFTSSSNPFCTRFVRPGVIHYQFAASPTKVLGPLGCLDHYSAIIHNLSIVRFGQIVGPHGTGKSTLVASLLEWGDGDFAAVTAVHLCGPATISWWSHARHRLRAMRRVRSEQAGLVDGGLLVVDGAEQLGRSDWRRLLSLARRRGQAVLATSHRELAGMEVLHRTGNSPELIRSLTQWLVRGKPDHVLDQVNAALASRSLSESTNVRDLWFELYDGVQFSTRRASE